MMFFKKYWIWINIILIVLIIELIFIGQRKQEWKIYIKKWKQQKIKILKEKFNNTDNITLKKNIIEEIKKIKKFPIKKRAIYVKKWNREEYCITCHIGIKSISKSHPKKIFGCVICHGGDPLSLTVKGAHKNLIGGENPSDLKYAEKSCGQIAPDGTRCHPDIVKRVKTSLMYTMAGVITSLRYEWNIQNSKKPFFATHDVKDDYGHYLKKIPNDNFADDYFRKMCAMCHIGVKNPFSTSNHSSGCAACHVIYNNNSHYLGEDPTIDKNKRGFPPYHEITAKIPTSQCLKCHNRSSRYGTSYIGLGENDFYPVPLKHGEFSQEKMLGGRYFNHFQADIHYKKGMDCIDCHTGKEIMGDGIIHSRMFEQTTVKCEDCHGTYNSLPQVYKIKYFSDPLLQISTYNLKLNDKIVKTKKGDFLWNVKKEKGGFYLYSKTKNLKLKIKTIYHNKFHKPNPCNKHLECYTCHFSWTMLCYGCHVGYNKNKSQRDALTGKKTKGLWYERRSYTRYSDIVLIINSEGKYSPAQFCQSQVTIPFKNFFNKVFIHKDNTTSYVVVPVQPHTITKASKKCADCHNNSMAVGIGKGSLKFYDNGTIKFTPIYNSKKSGMNINFPMESIVSYDGKVQYQSVSDNRFKVLKRKQILKILKVGKCTICHEKYNEKLFNYYKKGLPCPKTEGD